MDSEKKQIDKLVQVYLKDGSEKWILIHIEVQGYNDLNFPERMFKYFYRIYDKYGKKIVALAIFLEYERKLVEIKGGEEAVGLTWDKSNLAQVYKQIGIEEGVKKGIEKGMEKGRKLQSIEIAKNLLSLGLDIEQIQKATGISEEEIKKLVH